VRGTADHDRRVSIRRCARIAIEVIDLVAGASVGTAKVKELQRLLPANDQFWPRWLLDGDAMNLVKPKKKRTRSA